MLELENNSPSSVDISSLINTTPPTTLDWDSLTNIPADIADGDSVLTEATVDAFVSNNGFLTIEQDSSITNEIQNLSLSSDSLALSQSANKIDLSIYKDNTDNQQITNFSIAGNDLVLELENNSPSSVDISSLINTTPPTTLDWDSLTNIPADIADGDSVLTEATVDAFVSNNGFLTIEQDSSITNEIQTLSLSNDSLILSNPSGNADTVDLSGYINNPDTSSVIADQDNDTRVIVENGADTDKIEFQLDNGTSAQTYIQFIDSGRIEILHPRSNIYIGDQAGLNNNTGTENIAIGNSAGKNNNGSGNLFIGHNAAESQFNDRNNLLVIHNQDSDSLESLVYGEFDNKLLRINTDSTYLKGSLTLGQFPGKYDEPSTKPYMLWVDGDPGYNQYKIDTIHFDSMVSYIKEDLIEQCPMGMFAMDNATCIDSTVYNIDNDLMSFVTGEALDYFQANSFCRNIQKRLCSIEEIHYASEIITTDNIIPLQIAPGSPGEWCSNWGMSSVQTIKDVDTGPTVILEIAADPYTNLNPFRCCFDRK